MTLAVANTPALTEAPSCDFDGHVSDWLNIVAISLKLIGNVFVESVSLNMLISILADEFEHESKRRARFHSPFTASSNMLEYRFNAED